MTLEQLEAFYTAHYLRLVKTLVLLDATIEEAEDAVQKAMADCIRRSRTATPPDHPAAWVQQAAIHYFIKERQRDRERLPREIRGGHLTIDASLDDRLTDLEDNQDIERLLGCLTLAQQKVIKLVMAGLSTHEIAGELSKSDENIRQHLKNSRDRLKRHPEITVPAARPGQSTGRQEVRSTVTTPEPGKEEVQ